MTMIGQVLNHRYEILEKIGEGGMAVAYRGRDRVLGRVVAIKVMRPELASDAEFLARFRREARAAAGITHEHIAGVYDTGHDGLNHYIVMEYVEGESLRDRLRREGPLPLPDALRIARETAEALEAAHAAGIVHRDIKPHNVLLGRDGQVKVTDFGIARAITTAGHTDTGRLVGSVNYVSPEQARGDAVGPQADLYSLGITLFEMLTGRTPFDGADRLAVLHRHIYDRPPLVSEFRRGLPAEVESIVDHCLEKDLSRRFASAREVMSYLDACPRVESQGWEKTLGVVSRARRLSRAMEEWGQRLRRHAVLVAFIVVLVAAAMVALAVVLPGRLSAQSAAIPDLVGMSERAARLQVEALGFSYREKGRHPSEDVSPGSVLSQDPAPGHRWPKGTVIKVVISEGSDQVVVPNVSEMTMATAQVHLQASNLTSGKVRESYDDRVPKGYVRTTFPAAGAKVVKGTAIDVEVSLGPKPTIAPPPPLPTPPGDGTGQSGRRETVTYRIPTDVGDPDTPVRVVVELVDEEGRVTPIYDGFHKPDEAIPSQTFLVSKPLTLRVLVDGVVRERQSLRP